MFFFFYQVALFFMTLIRVPKNCNDQFSSARIPTNLNPALKEMIFDSVEMCENEVCFVNTKTHNVPTDVDFESSRSPAKSESYSPNLQSLAVFPT